MYFWGQITSYVQNNIITPTLLPDKTLLDMSSMRGDPKES